MGEIGAQGYFHKIKTDFSHALLAFISLISQKTPLTSVSILHLKKTKNQKPKNAPPKHKPKPKPKQTPKTKNPKNCYGRNEYFHVLACLGISRAYTPVVIWAVSLPQCAFARKKHPQRAYCLLGNRDFQSFGLPLSGSFVGGGVTPTHIFQISGMVDFSRKPSLTPSRPHSNSTRPSAGSTHQCPSSYVHL